MRRWLTMPTALARVAALLGVAALLAAACGGDGAADENEDEARVAEARAAVASATGSFDDPDRVLTLEEYFQRLHVRIRSFELTRANVENTVMAIVLRAQDRLDAVPALREYYEFTASSRGALADQLDGMRPPEAVAAGHGALLANTRAQQAIEMDILDTMAQNVPTSDELEEAETLQAEQRRLEVEAAEICRGLQALATANGVQVTLFCALPQ